MVDKRTNPVRRDDNLRAAFDVVNDEKLTLRCIYLLIQRLEAKLSQRIQS